jgi:hypothetical protein
MFVHQMPGKGYATMSTTIRYSPVAGMLLLIWGSVPADAEGPQLAASNTQPISDAGRRTIIVTPTIHVAESIPAAKTVNKR